MMEEEDSLLNDLSCAGKKIFCCKRLLTILIHVTKSIKRCRSFFLILSTALAWLFTLSWTLRLMDEVFNHFLNFFSFLKCQMSIFPYIRCFSMKNDEFCWRGRVQRRKKKGNWEDFSNKIVKHFELSLIFTFSRSTWHLNWHKFLKMIESRMLETS